LSFCALTNAITIIIELSHADCKGVGALRQRARQCFLDDEDAFLPESLSAGGLSSGPSTPQGEVKTLASKLKFVFSYNLTSLITKEKSKTDEQKKLTRNPGTRPKKKPRLLANRRRRLWAV